MIAVSTFVDAASVEESAKAILPCGRERTNENDVQDKMDDRMELACAHIKAADNSIYTVAFEITDTTTKQVLVACASDSSKAFSADSTAELTAAFTSIGDDISQLRLSKWAPAACRRQRQHRRSRFLNVELGDDPTRGISRL